MAKVPRTRAYSRHRLISRTGCRALNAPILPASRMGMKHKSARTPHEFALATPWTFMLDNLVRCSRVVHMCSITRHLQQYQHQKDTAKSSRESIVSKTEENRSKTKQPAPTAFCLKCPECQAKEDAQARSRQSGLWTSTKSIKDYSSSPRARLQLIRTTHKAATRTCATPTPRATRPLSSI